MTKPKSDPNSAHTATVFILRILKATIKEQTDVKLLDKETGNYIYDAVWEQVVRKGWI
jgi:hypothetical protein